MSEELVTVATFATEHEAEIARGFLESNSVHAFLADESVYRIASSLKAGMGGIRLQVRPEDESRARSLLAEVRAGDHS
jgi:Putative prokaryotic signal transducing protein